MFKLCFVMVFCLIVCGTIFFQDGWEFRPGVVVVSGSGDHSFKNTRGQLLTVRGYRRISRAEISPVSVYHALIFLPQAPLAGGGGGFSNKDAGSTEVLTWRLQKNPPNDYRNVEEKRLELKYHPLEKTLTVGSQTFQLARGNLFIVRLNDEWLPTAEQIPAHFEEDMESQRVLDQKVLDFFKSALPDEQEIQKLELY